MVSVRPDRALWSGTDVVLHRLRHADHLHHPVLSKPRLGRCGLLPEHVWRVLYPRPPAVHRCHQPPRRLQRGHRLHGCGDLRTADALAFTEQRHCSGWGRTDRCGAFTGLPGAGRGSDQKRTYPSRGAGLSAYAVFFDLALAIAGPVMGAIALGQGYDWIFFYAALLSACALALTIWLSRRTANQTYPA
ncbi:Major facilitator superfamily transporter [Pseudomonas amygdali pv. photiniae]|uniref:Major facilitator superfamily transporter n=1 Tax=Pseudomonas amygdali pv. photiniae TaxID=251724 RepID=A0A0P9UMI7_PSEA0|nr:Major facilitator superfamily transporter [Pseudomonas amygdali pv. photiniae]